MGLLKQLALVALTLCTLALAPSAAAQDASTAAADLRDNDVTFEEGALTDRDLAELDQVTNGLQEPGAAFKVVVLAEDVTDYAGADAFAAAVLDRLGTDGRVLVYTPSSVGLASDIDAREEVASAKARAVDAANATNSYGAGVEAAANELGAAQGAGDDTGGGGGGGGGWLLLLILLLVPAVLLFFLWRRSKRRDQKLDATQIASAEGRVRGEVDAAANLILELSDRADLPDTAPTAREHFREGARLFSESQELLEEADTRPELEAAFPKIVEARWRLECSKAILDGGVEPTRLEPEPLFAAPPTEPVDVPGQTPRPEPAYRGFDTNPWLTTAAMAAMAALVNRGMTGQTRHRQPMDDSVFGDIFGGGGRYGGGGYGRPRTTPSRPRISLGTGRAGRGMGRRR